MLLSFNVENFRSIRGEEHLSLLASRHTALPESLALSKHAKHGILPMAAVFGPNAAGKTNLIRALTFFSSAVRDSHNNWKVDGKIPFDKHFFREDEPSFFEAAILLEDEVYRYGFRSTQSEFIEEWLLKGKKTLFRRLKHHFTFGPSFRGSKNVSAYTRANSLFLSTAIQNNHKSLLPIASWIARWNVIGNSRFPEQSFTVQLLENEGAKRFLLEALSVIDNQIVGLERSTTRRDPPVEIGDPRLQVIFDAAMDWESLTLTHRDSQSAREAKIHLEDESAGTQNYLALLAPIMAVLNSGNLLLIDEADSSLHPTLLRALILLFQSPRTNPRKAQLIFNTHDTTLLTNSVLRPDEVWFADRDGCNGSHFYSLADFSGVRSDMSAQKSYLDGRFGAIPFLEDHLEIFARELDKFAPKDKRKRASDAEQKT